MCLQYANVQWQLLIKTDFLGFQQVFAIAIFILSTIIPGYPNYS